MSNLLSHTLRSLRVMACAMRDGEKVGINSIISFQIEASLSVLDTCSMFGSSDDFNTSIEFGSNAVDVIDNLLKPKRA